MSASRIGTPCIGTCSCTFGDAICRGCKRYDTEVRDWNALSDAERQETWARLNSTREQVLGRWFEVTDPERLAQAMDANAIRRQPNYSPLAWVEDLLRACKTQHPPYERIGIRPFNGAEKTDLVTLRAEIQDKLLAETLIVRLTTTRRDAVQSEFAPGGM